MTDSSKEWKGEIGDAFDAGGLLDSHIDNYVSRFEQSEMAAAVADVIDGDGHAVLEAGTGTGKTFAYLVPIILSGSRAIVSTSTKALQDQLFSKDVPFLKKALGKGVKVRLLKGRSNYLCQRRHELAVQGGLGISLFPNDRFIESDLSKVTQFSEITIDGDVVGVDGVKTFSKAWPLVTSTRDNCTGNKCSHFDDCFYYRALSEARSADVVITNHAMLMSLAASGNDIFASFDLCVFDEAHALVDDVRKFFSTSMSTRDIFRALEEDEWIIAQSKARTGHEEDGNVGKEGGDDEGDNGTGEGSDLVTDDTVMRAMEQAMAECETLEDLARKMKRSQDGNKTLVSKGRGKSAFEGLARSLETISASEDAAALDDGSLTQFASSASSFIDDWNDDSKDSLSWLERKRSTLTFYKTPLGVAPMFAESFLKRYRTILVSATLSYDGSLEHASKQLGMEKAAAQSWIGPFDYEKNGLMLLPQGMPEPRNQEEFVDGCVELAVKLVRANEGRAFMLFATLANLRSASELMRRELGNEYTLLVQGDENADQLLREFKEDEGRKKVLLGSRTFWQGVDVQGKALSLLVIDKIPFYNVNDPIYSAIEERMSKESSPFSELQLPKATLLLKQAAGRLIRNDSDKGVLVICDPRLTSRGYGAKIIRSLQPMQRTSKVDEAVEFLRSM